MTIPRTTLCDRYEQLYPGAVADTLDEFGYKSRALPSTIGPLTREMQMAGIAYPVRGYPDEEVDYDTNIRNFLRMLRDAPEESVVAYETNDDEAAHIGELSVTTLKENGCRGAVVDGGARDIRYILNTDLPVFTRYQTPLDAPPRWRVVDWGIPISVGDIEIRPGDVLVGDVDGVVCVPRDVREEVLERAEETVEEENQVRVLIKDGSDPVEAYEEHGKF